MPYALTLEEVAEIRSHAYRAGSTDERAKIVAWMRTFPLNKHAREWADAIEAGDVVRPGPDVSACGGAPEDPRPVCDTPSEHGYACRCR